MPLSRLSPGGIVGDSFQAERSSYIAPASSGGRVSGSHRKNSTRSTWLYQCQSVSHAAVLPDLPGDEKVAPLVRRLSWTLNLIILRQTRRPEEREFYIRLAIQERWSRRELKRQFKAALFERAVLTPAKVSPPVRQLDSAAVSIFKDSYMLEFLKLPAGHAEADLHKALLLKVKKFLIELVATSVSLPPSTHCRLAVATSFSTFCSSIVVSISRSPSSLRLVDLNRSTSANISGKWANNRLLGQIRQTPDAGSRPTLCMTKDVITR